MHREKSIFLVTKRFFIVLQRMIYLNWSLGIFVVVVVLKE